MTELERLQRSIDGIPASFNPRLCTYRRNAVSS